MGKNEKRSGSLESLTDTVGCCDEPDNSFEMDSTSKMPM